LINAVDDYLSSSMINIQKQEIMINWFFSKDFSLDMHIVFSDNDFTFDKIALKYLKHYIKNFDAEFDAAWKLLFMNNHDSHTISEFVNLTNDNHVRLFSFISHLTHLCNRWM
jgi:hypothetical protein